MKTILLAEDNDILRMQFSFLIQDKGYTVFEVKDGQELFNSALNFFNYLEEIVIISDTDMPKMNGPQACKKLIQQFPEYKKTIMIGMSDDQINENSWRGIGIIHSFIYKSTRISDHLYQNNLAELLESRINAITSNPSIYKKDDGTYRRYIL